MYIGEIMINTQQINKNNEDGMQAIYQAMSYAISQQINKAPYDRTFIALVTAVNSEDNTYTIAVDGHEYSGVPSTIRTYKNRTVIVMCPQGQFSQLFIYGEFNTTDYSA